VISFLGHAALFAVFDTLHPVHLVAAVEIALPSTAAFTVVGHGRFPLLWYLRLAGEYFRMTKLDRVMQETRKRSQKKSLPP